MSFFCYDLVFTSNLNINYHIKYIFNFFFIICIHCVQGLSGQPLSGPDIGGFAGNATPRLFGRWMGVGSLFPFCRGHSEVGTTDHEPWSFGEEVGSTLAV
jgi:alpha-glucosidase (family GH31 glycosyl hydrolase)